MKRIHLGIFSAVLTLSGVCASAQTVQFGVQGGLNLPLGDLDKKVDGRQGFVVGGHAGLYYGNGHELRPWVDFTYYNGGWQPGVGGTFGKSTVSAFGAGADYVYYTETRPQGIYLTMGLGLQNWNVNPNQGPSTSKTSLTLAAGAGYRINRSVSAEGRVLLGQFQANSGQATALQALVSIRL